MKQKLAVTGSTHTKEDAKKTVSLSTIVYELTETARIRVLLWCYADCRGCHKYYFVSTHDINNRNERKLDSYGFRPKHGGGGGCSKRPKKTDGTTTYDLTTQSRVDQFIITNKQRYCKPMTIQDVCYLNIVDICNTTTRMRMIILRGCRCVYCIEPSPW